MDRKGISTVLREGFAVVAALAILGFVSTPTFAAGPKPPMSTPTGETGTH